MPTRLDPLEYLERGDKWYLAGGKGAMFAPAFPRWLNSFGFWDEAYFADVKIERLFTILLLGENERPISLERDNRRWTPDALTQTFVSDDGLRIREDKVVTQHDTLASRLVIFNDGKRARSLNLILWSLQDVRDLKSGPGTTAADATRAGDLLTFSHSISYGESAYGDRPADAAGWGERPQSSAVGPCILHVALGADRAAVSHAIGFAETANNAPLWETSIVTERFQNGRLVQGKIPDSAAGGQLHLCQHYTLEVPVGESRSIQFGACVGLDRDRAMHYAQNDLQGDVSAESRKAWHDYYAGVPYFACSDPHLQRYYWYRWYGLRLLTVDLRSEQAPRFPNPCVFEGIGGFRCHISYSAQCHMRETGWMASRELAYGCLEGILASQEHSGFIPGHIYLWREDRGFYHADWGGCALQLYHMTADRSFVERVYPGLSRYADYFERERDREDSHLYDIIDQGETGQEYMSRYLFVDESADDWRRIQLKGVDSTVYVYRLQRALAEMARLLGKQPESDVWDRKADMTRRAVRDKMWDPEREFFFDVDPRSGERSPYKAAVGFYPFLCDIAGEEHLPAIHRHLLDESEFWTPFPVPASSVDDPYFNAEGEWKGHRMSCPWNGRVWPMTNSHVCEALARAALTLDPSLKPQAAELIHRFVKMLFFDGNHRRPNAFEHYNPTTGMPCVYRGIDDYQHSWVIDLLMKYLVGLQPHGGNTLVFDPLPFPVDSFAVEGIRYRDHSIDVGWDRDGYRVQLDGSEAARQPTRGRISINL